MKVSYNDKQYYISWRHNRDYFRNSDVMKSYGGETECIIKIDGKVITKGYAICHPNDNYSKKIGRKLSLTNAMIDIEDKDFRKSVWDEYRKSISA